MQIVELFENYFWNTAIASVNLIIPIIVIILIMKILQYFIVKGGD